MAITKLGGVVTGIRGTVGGVVYSANGSGTYAKRWTGTVNPRSAKQSMQRMWLGSMGAGWSVLTAGQRADWDAFAADPAQELINSLGDAYYASGYNWFCSCNTRLARIGRSQIQDAPVEARPGAPAVNANGLRVEPAGSDDDQCNGGTASASSEVAGGSAGNAFNGSLTSRWLSTASGTPWWLQYEFTGPVAIQRYRIYSGATGVTNEPKDWTFEYYDGGAWVTVHTVTGAAFAASTWYEYNFANTVASTKWRILVTATQGASASCGIFEMEMMTALYGQSMVMYPAGEFVSAPTWDIVVEVSQQPTISRGAAYAGYYEVVASQTPGSEWSGIQSGLDGVFGIIQPGRRWFARVSRQTQEGVRSAATSIEANTWPG